MKFILTLDCDNAAFGDNAETRAEEIRLILRHASQIVWNVKETGVMMLRDTNGNTVGRMQFQE